MCVSFICFLLALLSKTEIIPVLYAMFTLGAGLSVFLWAVFLIASEFHMGKGTLLENEKSIESVRELISKNDEQTLIAIESCKRGRLVRSRARCLPTRNCRRR